MRDAYLLVLAAGQMEFYATFARPELAEIFREAGAAFTRAAGGTPGVPVAAHSPLQAQPAEQQAHLN